LKMWRARITHKKHPEGPCGATVEFVEEDVMEDTESAFVVCPYCFRCIEDSLLKWRLK
jgi:hypothetical protein